MARYLLDTDAVIDYLKGFAPSISLIQDLHNQGNFLCVCDVVIAEIYSGLKPNDRKKAARLLDACFFLPTSAEIAKQAGEWRYSYARRGVILSTTDVLVAATAYAYKAVILTGNLGHYPMKKGLVFPLPRAKH